MTDAKRVRLLVLAGVWPHVRENTEAANVVLHEMLFHLTGHPSFDVAFARIAATADEPSSAAHEAMCALEARGLTVLASIAMASAPPRNRVSRIASRYVAESPEALLPGAASANDVRALCDEWRVDCALTVWSEAATASLYDAPVCRMAYYGNPDHKVARARNEFDWEHRPHVFDPGAFVARLKGRIGEGAIKRAHLRVMRRFEAVVDVAANDAAFYRRNGVRATYIRNMWPSAVSATWESVRARTEQSTPLKIVANVGSLAATGNTLGLYTLATSVLPALKRTLGEGGFELHLFGAGQPHRYLTSVLDDPHILVRGFVDDLDAEILSAPVFLVTNNHSEFKVGNTRFLHAWSLGSCVIAFKGSAEAMPEIAHRRNALLAATPDEMATLVAEASRDTSLRRSLGRAGAETVATQFNPAVVTKEVADRLLEIVRDRTTA